MTSVSLTNALTRRRQLAKWRISFVCFGTAPQPGADNLSLEQWTFQFGDLPVSS